MLLSTVNKPKDYQDFGFNRLIVIVGRLLLAIGWTCYREQDAIYTNIRIHLSGMVTLAHIIPAVVIFTLRLCSVLRQHNRSASALVIEALSNINIRRPM
jgi:ammonia channel protein AmtB